MAKNPVGFAITNSTVGWNVTDFDDVFIRKDCFLEGGLWSWGSSQCGASGNNQIIRYSSPVQTISGGTNWRQVSSTTDNVAAVKSDGSLWLWGSAYGGVLGNEIGGTTSGRSSPVQTVSGGTDWKNVSVGTSFAAAIKTNGSLWLWGHNPDGRLGDNSVVSKSSPVQTFSAGTDWKQVSLGASHAAAIKLNGSLWLWGRNDTGGIGDNVSGVVQRSSPVQTISAGTNWKTVSAAFCNTLAIKTDGTLWTWGYGAVGRNGDGTTLNRSSPVQIAGGGNNWKAAEVNSAGGIAIKTDGTLWNWGAFLGNDTAGFASTPVQTISGGTNWRTPVKGGTRAAIKTDGSLWLWGTNTFGALGDNTGINRSSPVQTISGGTSWRSASAGNNIAAIREDCW